MYSLACVLYECLIGHEPFTGEMVAVMWAQINTPPPAPTAVRPGLPAAVDQVIARGMAKDPASRYSTVGELAAAMLAAVDPGVRQAPAPEPVPPAAVTYIPGQTGPARTAPDRRRRPAVGSRPSRPAPRPRCAPSWPTPSWGWPRWPARRP